VGAPRARRTSRCRRTSPGTIFPSWPCGASRRGRRPAGYRIWQDLQGPGSQRMQLCRACGIMAWGWAHAADARAPSAVPGGLRPRRPGQRWARRLLPLVSARRRVFIQSRARPAWMASPVPDLPLTCLPGARGNAPAAVRPALGSAPCHAAHHGSPSLDPDRPGCARSGLRGAGDRAGHGRRAGRLHELPRPVARPHADALEGAAPWANKAMNRDAYWPCRRINGSPCLLRCG